MQRHSTARRLVSVDNLEAGCLFATWAMSHTDYFVTFSQRWPIARRKLCVEHQPSSEPFAQRQATMERQFCNHRV
jgi:hypothetical protein